MFEYLGTKYVPIEEGEDFFAGSAVEVGPRLIGCVLHHDNRGKDTCVCRKLDSTILMVKAAKDRP